MSRPITTPSKETGHRRHARGVTSKQKFSEFLRLAIKALALKHSPLPRATRKGSAISLVTLKEDSQTLHWTFYELQRRYGNSFPALRELHFIESGAFPYSPELTDALDRLQMSGAISRENPSYEKFSVTGYKDTPGFVERKKRQLIGADRKLEKAFDQIIDELEARLIA